MGLLTPPFMAKKQKRQMDRRMKQGPILLSYFDMFHCLFSLNQSASGIHFSICACARLLKEMSTGCTCYVFTWVQVRNWSALRLSIALSKCWKFDKILVKMLDMIGNARGSFLILFLGHKTRRIHLRFQLHMNDMCKTHATVISLLPAVSKVHSVVLTSLHEWTCKSGWMDTGGIR